MFFYTDLKFLKKSTPTDRFFEELLMAISLYSQSFCQKFAERKSPKKYFLYFVLMSAWGSNPDLRSNRPSYYLLDYGDINMGLQPHFNHDNSVERNLKVMSREFP